MKGQKRKQSGITLIALVISIIVMLILAGVSLNMTIGENGIVTQAQKAKEAHELAAIAEQLEMMMADFNIRGDMGSSALKTYMTEREEAGDIDSFKTQRKENTIQCIIEKDGHLFYAVPHGDYWSVSSIEGGETEEGGVELQVYTASNVSSEGTFELGQAGKETDVVFYEGIDSDLNFEIKEGTVNIYIYNDMYLSNEDITPARSAIDIHEGATLNLYLEEGATLTAYSGYGEAGEAGGTAYGARGGPGGFAGIHVPSTSSGVATLNVYGDGTLIAYGGNAGFGNGGTTGEISGGRRRWCWCRNWWKWWRWWTC